MDDSREDEMENTKEILRSARENDLLLGGLIELSRGNDAEALECFGRLLAGSGESTVAALCSAQLLMRRGDPLAAVDMLQALVEREPGCAEARCLLGQAYARGYRIIDAIRCYREALALSPRDAQARAALDELIDVQEP
jgi:predicted Zn-dependent protease